MKPGKNKKKQACAFVVFGATGDLTQNKLYPALYQLAKKDLLPSEFYLYGVAREDLGKKAFKKSIEDDIKRVVGKPADKSAIKTLLDRVEYISADLTQPDGYKKLEELIQREERNIGQAILRLFYLALPPSLFENVITNIQTCRLGKALCTKEQVLSRVILEKPFGHDYKSAKKLDKLVNKVFDERQIYRIDHYLGKSAFQMLFDFRFANAFFEEHWSAEHVESIQLNALETVDTENRASYYDNAGAIRDMVQSHLLQFLAYVLMDEPDSLDAADLQGARARLIKQIRHWPQKPFAFGGQYNGYKSEKGVKKGSTTETYAAVKFEAKNSRWKGVPIYMRTGKNLEYKETSVVVNFKHRSPLFLKEGVNVAQNKLMIQIAPIPSISLQMNLNKPGFFQETEVMPMHYCRPEQNNNSKEVGDYERLLLDVIEGDQLLFTSSEEILNAWKTVDPVIGMLEKQKLLPYKKGSIGPKVSEQLFDDGNSWMSVGTSCPADAKYK